MSLTRVKISNRRVGWAAAALAVLALALAACGGSATEPAAVPTAIPPTVAAAATNEPTAVPEPTSAPTDEPTSQPEPTTAPTDEPTSAPEPTTAPTDEPTAVPEPTTAPTEIPPTAAPTAEPAVTPSVTVANQPLVDDTVTIGQVVSDGPGWLVVHAQADGKPGAVLGYSPVGNGTNSNVTVSIDLAQATITLHAMLHTDTGQVGTYEFPGDDVPVQVGGQVITPAFQLQVLQGEAEAEMEDFQFRPKTLVIGVGTTVKWANKDEAEHTATSDTNVWDSGYLAKGEEFRFTFTAPGLYPYYCIPHGAPGGVGMAGTVIVLP